VASLTDSGRLGTLISMLMRMGLRALFWVFVFGGLGLGVTCYAGCAGAPLTLALSPKGRGD